MKIIEETIKQRVRILLGKKKRAASRSKVLIRSDLIRREPTEEHMFPNSQTLYIHPVPEPHSLNPKPRSMTPETLTSKPET